jgi:hypothetical protein
MLRQSDTDTHIARWLQTEFRPRPGRTLDVTKPVQVYRCLTGGQGRYSIRQGRHVVGHAKHGRPQGIETIDVYVMREGTAAPGSHRTATGT